MSRFFYFGLLLLFIVSCKKEQQPVAPVPVRNAGLKVTVVKYYLNKYKEQADSTLKNALVKIYQTKEDRSENTNAEDSLYTDATGLAYFNTLKKDYYYITVSYPAFGTVYDEVTTPDNNTILDKVGFQ